MKKMEKELILRIDQLIRLKATGSTKELSDKLNISERTTYYLLKKIKEKFNAPISYNKYRKSYEYSINGKIIINFIPDKLNKDDLLKIKGGISINNNNYCKNVAVSVANFMTIF